MKILITGCCGFIGFNFTNSLAKSNKNIKIVGIDNLNNYYSINLKKKRLKILSKIVSIKTKNKNILKKVFKIYNQISKKIIISENIRAAETAKVIENIQRDINIALMNEVLLICTKLKINFNEVIRLAKSKWNFINFKPGLVGGALSTCGSILFIKHSFEKKI